MSLLWSQPSNGGCGAWLGQPLVETKLRTGAEILFVCSVFLWLTGNKLLDVDHCADYRPHNIVPPVIVLEALSRRPPVFMTFDKFPINNRVICDSRLFGGPRSEARWARAPWALGLGEWGVKVENTGIRVSTGTPLIWNISLKNNPPEWDSILILRWSELRVIP